MSAYSVEKDKGVTAMPKLTDEYVVLISKTAIETYENHKQQQEQKKHDRRLRNIKLLLRNYRSFVRHCKDIKLEIQDINEEIEWAALDSEEFKLESIKRSKEKTLAMVRYIDKMLAVYKVMCEEEGAEAKRRYHVISSLYINSPKMSVKELSDVHFISERTIRRDREKACEALAVLMFGIDAVRFK